LLGGIFMQGEIDIEILQKWSNDFYPGKIFLEKIAKLIISSFHQENIYLEENPVTDSTIFLPKRLCLFLFL
jgi:hypothetical protein